MLLESIVRKTLGVKKHKVKSIEQEGGRILIRLDVRRGVRLCCGVCGKTGRVRDRLNVRRWRHVPLWGIAVILEYAPARVFCRDCGRVLVEALSLESGKEPSFGWFDLDVVGLVQASGLEPSGPVI